MTAHLTDWLELILRWVHVITGVAWIGTSFYFNWLNSRLHAPDRREPGVAGELWSVHGGGFYRVVKYEVAPERLPRTLHWFKWEAYATWLSGFALLAVVYYLAADTFLVDAESPIGAHAAIGIGLATLILGWLGYDLLCRALATRPVLLTAAGFLLAAAGAWALTTVVSDRGAYIHVGAMLGTIMAANVFRVIIPSQREMVEAMADGRAPNATLGKQAALRSLHNNYLTLPVLFIMVSNHYPMTYGNRWNWAILAGIAVIGAGTRHWFNLRNQGHHNAWILPAAVVGILALAVVSSPRTPAAGDAVTFADVQAIVQRRCVTCHAEHPTFVAYAAPPLDVRLETADQIAQHVDRIKRVTVDTKIMPLGNVTGMTDEEREMLGRWIAAGARR